MRQISIIGLGLIGGSLAKAFRKNSICDILVGVDTQKSNIVKAENDGVIQRGYSEITQDVLDSDMIFICTHIRGCVKLLDSIAGKVNRNCIISDICSTKKEIISKVNSIKNFPVFIGGHPMAGSEKSGYCNANSELFQDSIYLIVKSYTSTDESVKILEDIITKIGAKAVQISPQEHDDLVAVTSHLPHIIASALVNSLEEDFSLYRSFIASGFKDSTRIASSNSYMWEQIFMSNSTNILEYIDVFQKQIEKVKLSLINKEKEKVIAFLEKAKFQRELLISE